MKVFITLCHRLFAKRLSIAHEIRSEKTQRAKAVCALNGKNRWTISGTPIQNSWRDLVSLLNFLKVPLVYHDNRQAKALFKDSGADPYIRGLISSICLRRPKTAIELPSRVDKIHHVTFETGEARHYNAMNDAIVATLEHGLGDNDLSTYSNILAKINTLRQICNLGTHYQGPGISQQQDESNSTKAQKLLDGLLSTGVTLCSICERNLQRGHLSSESLLGEVQSDAYSLPRLALCGELICASCTARGESMGNVTTLQCRHQPSCCFFEVNVDQSTPLDMHSFASRLPSKISKLQRDIIALPQTEKRWVTVFTCLKSFSHITQHRIFLLDDHIRPCRYRSTADWDHSQ